MRTAGSSEPGKISKVLWITAEFPEEVEADLQRYYGIDYLDHFRGRLGWRRLLVLLEHLPPESAVNTAVRNAQPAGTLAQRARQADPARAPWSTVETLLAVLVDEVRINSWLYASAHSERRLKPPTPIQRPGTEVRRGRVMSLEEARLIDPRLRALSDEEAVEMFARIHG